MAKIEVKKAPLFHLFDYDRYPPSIANLDPALTINGVTAYSSVRYNPNVAAAAGWAQWGYGSGLVLSGSGTAPDYNNGSLLLGSVDDGIRFNSGSYFSATNAATANVTTEDLVIEAVVEYSGVSSSYLSKGNGNSVVGYSLSSTGSSIGFYASTGVANANVSGSALTSSCVYHVMVFVNRDEASTNGSQVYINGLASGPGVDFSGVAATITTTNYLSIGANSNGTMNSFARIFYLALWQQAAWHQAGASGPVEWAGIAQQRFAKLTGIYPVQSRGTALPVISSSNTPRYLDKIESGGVRKLYQVGANWMRSCSRVDADGKSIKGYLGETAATNIFSYSEDLSNWVPTRASVPTTAVIGPDGKTRNTSTLHEDNTPANNHFVSRGPATTNGVQYIWSTWLKAGLRNWAFIQQGWVTNHRIYCNLTNGTIGSTVVGSPSSYGVESWGNGWYRYWITAVADGIADTCIVGVAESDGDITFDGLDQDSLYVFGAQLESGSTVPTSYLSCSVAATGRLADQLQYSTTSNFSTTGSISFKTLAFSGSVEPLAPTYFHISDGTDDNKITVLHNANSELVSYVVVNGTTTQVSASSTADCRNGRVQQFDIRFSSGSSIMTQNGVQMVNDTLCVIPSASMTQLRIGGYRSVGGEANALISDFKIREK